MVYIVHPMPCSHLSPVFATVVNRKKTPHMRQIFTPGNHRHHHHHHIGVSRIFASIRKVVWCHQKLSLLGHQKAKGGLLFNTARKRSVVSIRLDPEEPAADRSTERPTISICFKSHKTNNISGDPKRETERAFSVVHCNWSKASLELNHILLETCTLVLLLFIV